MFHSELRYPAMRGFPIVSLGAITSSTDTFFSVTPHNATIVIPDFEVEEYFFGNKSVAFNKYKGGYYQSSYVDSVEIKPNNLSLKVGSQSIISGSYGFLFNDTTPWDNHIYSNETKIENLEKYRIDSYYCLSFEPLFFWHSPAQNSKNDYKKDKNIYINVPNLLMFGYHHTFSISLYTEKLYLNIPKLTDFSSQLFNSLDESIELNFNVNLNSQSALLVGSYAKGNWTISSTILASASKIKDLLYENRAIFVTESTANFIGSMTVGRNNVPLSEFDLRYWDLWQNESGSDC